MTLTDFLLARIAEDEVAAKFVVPAEHHADLRQLRECEAKRRILHQVIDLDLFDGYTEATRDAVMHLAAVYDDHPDYDEGWRP